MTAVVLMTLLAQCPVQPHPRPEEAPAELSADESRFLGRLRPHIREQVQKEMLDALDEKAEGFGGAFAVKLAEFVKAAAKKAVEALILVVLVALFWQYFGHILAVGLGVPAAVAWLVSKRAAK